MRPAMGEHIAQLSTDRSATGRKRPSKQTPEALGRRLLDILVYAKRCRIGSKLTLDDLVERRKSAIGRCPSSGWHAPTLPLRGG
jgi:hypothetical protein